MGYRCTIKTDSYIDENDVQDMVDHIPETLQRYSFNNNKQVWGWSCACDIYKPEGNKIDIGGSYSISGDIAEDFVKYFELQLKVKNYKIISKKWSY